MTWTRATLPPNADSWATPYGLAIDHIWHAPEMHIARRGLWPKDTWIAVLPCRDLEPPTELSEGADQWVFFESGQEFAPTEEDYFATDWLLGEREAVG